MSAADPKDRIHLPAPEVCYQDAECREAHFVDLKTAEGVPTNSARAVAVSRPNEEDGPPELTARVVEDNAIEERWDRRIHAETGDSRSLDDTSAIPGTPGKTEQHETEKSCKSLEKTLEETDNSGVFKKPLEPKAPYSSRATRWGAPPLASLPSGSSIGTTFSDAQKRRVEDWVSSVAARASSLGATPDVLGEGPSNSEDDLASSSSPADVSKKDTADNDPKQPLGGEHSQTNTKITEKTIPLLSGVLKLHAKVEDENTVAVPGHSGGPALITPLPEGQFYNVEPSQNDHPPRAIYRKKDTDGVPVVFTSKIPDVSFWDLNPNHFARDLRAVAGDDIASHRMTNYGSLVVYVKTGEVAHKLLKLTNVAELPVTVHVPKSYSKNLGKIRTVPFHYTDSNLVTLLARVGVVKARRQMKIIRTKEGTNLRRSRSSVVLTFRDDIELPDFVRLGFFKFPVEPYVEAPLQCRNCQGFWHSSKGCRREARCRTCAGPHHFSVCTFKTRPRCANCRGPHTAIHFRCPVKYEAYRKKCWQLAHF